jgi:hypothetical protein
VKIGARVSACASFGSRAAKAARGRVMRRIFVHILLGVAHTFIFIEAVHWFVPEPEKSALLVGITNQSFFFIGTFALISYLISTYIRNRDKPL